MQTEIVYSLRNRDIYTQHFKSIIDDVFSFLDKYREFLTDEHLIISSALKTSAFIDFETVKSIFRYLLNFVEIHFSKSRDTKYYLEMNGINTPEQLILMNESIYCIRVNYLNMKRDLYEMYNTHIDSSNKYIANFLKAYKKIKRNIDMQYDDSQIMLDNNVIFGI